MGAPGAIPVAVCAQWREVYTSAAAKRESRLHLTTESGRNFTVDQASPARAALRIPRLVATAAFLSASLAAPTVEAEEYRIVAVGASNTAGRGVGALLAWPARLEAVLRGRGYDVRVVNAGINGDDTNGMRARIQETVPDRTQLVILDTTDTNDRRREINTKSNVTAIAGELAKRGIRILVISSLHAMSDQQLQGDGIHITAEGHALIATKLAPHVSTILGSPPRRK
jgi:acyl-CoA thioesterase-1